MWQVADGLYGFFEFRFPDFVEDKGEDDGHREANADAEQAHDKRVAYYTREKRVRQELPEILKPRPLAEPGQVTQLVVLECHEYAVHRDIHEYENKDDAGDDEYLLIPLEPHALQNMVLLVRNDS